MNTTDTTGNIISNGVDFGAGRYSAAMAELFTDSQRLLALSAEQAEKVARSFGADLGRQNAESKVSVGKINSKGKVTLKEGATMKGVAATPSIYIARQCVLLQELRSIGCIVTARKLAIDLEEWLG